MRGGHKKEDCSWVAPSEPFLPVFTPFCTHPLPHTHIDTGLDHDTCTGQWDLRKYETWRGLDHSLLETWDHHIVRNSSHTDRPPVGEIRGPADQPEWGPRPTALVELFQPNLAIQAIPAETSDVMEQSWTISTTAVALLQSVEWWKLDAARMPTNRGMMEGLHPSYRLMCEDHRRKTLTPAHPNTYHPIISEKANGSIVNNPDFVKIHSNP